MTIGRPRYGGFVWLNRAYDWPGQEDSYALSGTGGQSTVIFPRSGHKLLHSGSVSPEDQRHLLRGRVANAADYAPISRQAWPARPTGTSRVRGFGPCSGSPLTPVR